MLFMITFSCHNPVEARTRWLNTVESFEGLELIGRWHAVGNTGGLCNGTTYSISRCVR